MTSMNYFLPGFVLLLLMWSYYVYVIEFSIKSLDVVWKKAVYLCICHLIFLPMIWSFFDIMMTSLGEVSETYKLSDNQHDNFISYNTEAEADVYLKRIVTARNIVLYSCTSQRRIRYCLDCKQIKPDRTHHCSQCDICVLKMDHHCPWVNTCIGFHNYKSFVLFLTYLSLYTLYFVASMFEDFVSAWDAQKFMKQKIHLVVGFTVAVFVGVLSLFFFAYHLMLLLRNETTIENMYPMYVYDTNMTFDMGWRQNIVEVFGNKWYLWLIPIFSSLGTGEDFEVRQIEEQ